VCWRHHAIATGRSAWFDRQTYARLTGRPVLILAGGRDAFDANAEACHQFVAALPSEAQAAFKVTVYPTATFGWDSRFGSATYDAGVAQGRGGINTIVADPEVARQSREAVASFFAATLAPPR
jgi:dienelactone hydrolase